MSRAVSICRSSEVAEGELKRFSIGEMDLCLARIDGRVYALEDRCGHMGAPLSLGKLEGRVVTCPLHQGASDFTTGAIVRPPNVPVPAQAESNPRARMFSLVRTYPLRTLAVEEKRGEITARLDQARP